MTSKELIKLLQEADPSGELEVSIDNETVTGVFELPAYYDGNHQRVSYDPPSAKLVSNGRKLILHHIGLELFLLDHPDAPVDLSEAASNPAMLEYYEEKVREYRFDGRITSGALPNPKEVA